MTLRELLEQADLPEGAEELLEQRPLTREEETRILALTLAKAGLDPAEKKEKKATMKKSRFGLMLMAGVLCAGAVVASAAGYFTMNRSLARHLDAEGDKGPLVSQAGVDLGESCTVDGWTITAVQALGDKTQVRVLLDVTAPEGTVLEEGNYRVELPMIEPSVTFTIDQVEDEDPTDNKLSLILSSIPAKDYRGKTMKLHIGGLSRYKKHTVEELDAGASPFDRDILIEGDFNLSFKLDYQDTSDTYSADVEIDTPRGKIKVEEVTLSPMSIHVTLSGEGTKPEPELPAHTVVNAFHATLYEGDEVKGYTIEVRDKDGNAIPWTTMDTEPDHFTMTFTQIIDPADVACVVIAGVEVPLTK